MDLLYNNNIINQIVTKLFRHRRNDYSELQMEHTIQAHDISHQLLPICNSNYERLHASLFTSPKPTTTCIVFMHGYGSNRLQCNNIMSFLGEMALCSFDFSGSGKSQGDTVTYGIKEKQDIRKDCTLNYLRRMGYKRFVLWGRSMGGTASLLYCMKYRPEDVVLQIIDSAFFSFEMIAFDIANKNVKAPQFVISFGLEMAKKNCAKFEYNPFEIVLSDVGHCNVPALFIFCQEDNVINPQNTQMISNKYKAAFEKLIIEENHNTIRSSKTVTKIFNFVDKYLKVSRKKPVLESLNNYFLDYTPKNIGSTKSLISDKLDFSTQQSKVRQKRGIKRVQKEKPHRNTKFDDYGIWVACKFQQIKPEPSEKRIDPSKKKERRETPRKLQLSLRSSVVHKPKSMDFGDIDTSELGGRQRSCMNSMGSCKGSLLSKKGKMTTVRSMGLRGHLNNSKYL